MFIPSTKQKTNLLTVIVWKITLMANIDSNLKIFVKNISQIAILYDYQDCLVQGLKKTSYMTY